LFIAAWSRAGCPGIAACRSGTGTSS
jgi:hypothetical protein